MTRIVRCDNCKAESKGIYLPSITVTCGYGSRHDGEELHFCNEQCLAEFYAKEMKELIRKKEEKKHD